MISEKCQKNWQVNGRSIIILFYYSLLGKQSKEMADFKSIAKKL